MDFVRNQLASGRRFRVLTAVDLCTQEALTLRAGTKLDGTDVVATLNDTAAQRGAPQRILCDNGIEFCGRIMDL